VTVKGINAPMLNLSSYDFLNLGSHPEAKKVVRAALHKYGVGSCGPRGFYGTIDVHLDFEKAIAEHFGVQESIAYSDGNSAVSSTITAFAKRGDLLLIDEACGEAIRTGAKLSRAHVHFFKHNDVESLREIMASVASDDKRLKRDSTQQRRFIIVEGLYRATGNICPLDEVIKLKEKYCYRILLDESTSFGCVGPTGRGVAELFGISMKKIDMFTISMATVLGAVGGVSLGTHEIVDHQRLSGPGYCFSASSPPFFSAAALANLSMLRNEKVFADLIGNLKRNIAEFQDSLDGIRGLTVFTAASSKGDSLSPVIHLALDETDDAVASLLARAPRDGSYWDAHEAIIVEIVNECNMSGVGVSASFTQDESIEGYEASGSALRPTIRVCITSGMAPKDIKFAAKVMKTSSSRVIDASVSRKK
jgi:serine palmitoyltransferase